MKLFSYTLLFSLLCVGLSFNLEDLMSKAVFPPNVPDIPREPKGHNKPLGWQRPPAAAIKEYTEPLTAIDYWRLHVEPHIPLVLRGYLKESPAIKNWNDEYLAEHYGNLDILVEHKLEDRTSTSGRMRLKDFLKNYKEQDLYVVSMFPSEMMHEVRAIPSVLCGTFKNFTHESNLWISNGGTRSVVHYDADHNLHCVIDGRKDFIMINNNLTTKTNLYFKRKDPGVGSGFSFLDPDTIDMNKFKNIAKVPWTWATLYPGDCIYIPSVYIHQVRGYGRTLAVTTLFTADIANNFNSDDCTDDIMKGYHSMDEINFQWTYKKGDKTIDMGYMNIEIVKNQLSEGMNDPRYSKDGKFTMKQFILHSGSFSPYGRNKTKMEIFWKEVFGFKEDTILDDDTFASLNIEQWKAYCRVVEEAHGVVTNGTEQVFIRPGERHQYEIEHPDDDTDEFMTERERQIKRETDRDPMFDYLSPEEKGEYIKKKKEQKAKLGLKYSVDEQMVDVGGEIPWKITDIPEKFRNSIAKGTIPAAFKEEFMNNLHESTKTRYAKELEKNVVPKRIISIIMDDPKEEYAERVLKQIHGENDDEFDNDNNEDGPNDENEDGSNDEQGEEDGNDREGDPNQFQFQFKDLEKKTKQLLLDGKISKQDINDFLTAIPLKYQQKYSTEIKNGELPQEVLLDLLGSSEETFDEDTRKYRKEFINIKDEL